MWKQSDRQNWAKGRGKWTPNEGEILSVGHTHVALHTDTHTLHMSVTLEANTHNEVDRAF